MDDMDDEADHDVEYFRNEVQPQSQSIQSNPIQYNSNSTLNFNYGLL